MATVSYILIMSYSRQTSIAARVLTTYCHCAGAILAEALLPYDLWHWSYLF